VSAAQPLVSVVIPAYNAGRFIAETIDSVLAQTHARREIVVVDDGSTDDTAERLRPYAGRIRCLRIAHGEAGAARNAGLREATGDFIAFLDADDLWLPDALAVQLDVAARHPESGMIVCDGVQFDGDRILAPRLIGGPSGERLARAPAGEVTGFVYREWLQTYGLCTPGQTLVPRHVADRIGPQETRPHAAVEWDYSLRIALSYPVTLHDHSLVRWRYHPTSASGPRGRREFRWALRRIPTLRRHRRLCARGDRPAVEVALRDAIRETAWSLYYHAWRPGERSYARAMLRRLARLAPADRTVLACLAVASLPSRLAPFLGSVGARVWRP